MAFNFGWSTGGVSNPSAWNEHKIHNNAVNFGSGGIRQGNIGTGDINNDQTSEATGGQLDQTADFKMDMPMPMLVNLQDVQIINLSQLSEADLYNL